jgi:hypothetical protein
LSNIPRRRHPYFCRWRRWRRNQSRQDEGSTAIGGSTQLADPDGESGSPRLWMPPRTHGMWVDWGHQQRHGSLTAKGTNQLLLSIDQQGRGWWQWWCRHRRGPKCLELMQVDLSLGLLVVFNQKNSNCKISEFE